MDLGLKGKVAMVAGASRGLGYAVAQALAREGALVSIASRDEQAIAAAAERIGGDSARDAGRRQVRRGDRAWTAATDAAFRRRRSAVHQLRRAARRRRGLVRRSRPGRRRPTCCCSAPPHGARRRAVDAGARRRRHPRCPPRRRSRNRSRISGCRPSCARRSRRWRRRSRSSSPRRRSASTRSSRAASTPTACGSSTRSPRRSRASPPKRPSASRWPRSRWPLRRDRTNIGRVAAFLLSAAACYMTGATVQVDGGLIRSVL